VEPGPGARRRESREHRLAVAGLSLAPSPSARTSLAPWR
jgi:hypothetical protein